jgi:uncharacterized membrane protein YsdA (DUF1294 family)
MNIAAFFFFAYDKFVAKYTKLSRVSENFLHLLSLCGGFFGATLAMVLFRHKSSKASFLLKHIFILLLWIAAFGYYLCRVKIIVCAF